MRPLSEATAQVAAKSFNRKYIALGRIVKHWEEIVGADLATKAQPVKINYRQKKVNRSTTPQVTLDIAASSADATLLHYQKDLILERINQIFGERWITGVRFVTMPVNTQAPKGRKHSKKANTPLTPTQKNHLSMMLEGVEDDEIRTRLEKLGQGIITEDT